MSRTNKGGVRLRVITGLTAAMAIAAGIYAATLHPLAEACDITPTSIFGGRSFQVSCTGLNNFLKYRLNSVSGPTTGLPNTMQSPSSGAINFSVSTNASDNTANTQVKLQVSTDNGSTWNDVSGASSDIVKAYYLSYPSLATTPAKDAPEEILVSGLTGDPSVKVGPMNGSSETADLAGWNDNGSSSVGGTGAFGSPYLLSTTSPYTVNLSPSSGSISGVYFQVENNTMSDISTRLAVYDSSGTLIGISPVIVSPH